MTKELTYPDLGKIISQAEAGIIDLEHKKLWNRFKQDWSEEDRVFWSKFRDKMVKDESGVPRLSPPPSDDEKAWAKKFIRRANEIGLC
jgi:hypothetical protein